MSLARKWAHYRGKRYGTPIWTAAGKSFWPLDPRVEDIDMKDIARGLASKCRFSGQISLTSGFNFYSEAEHSILVSRCAEMCARETGLSLDDVVDWALFGLLHDASKAYIGDISMQSSMKVEQHLQSTIEKAFLLTPSSSCRAVVQEIDNRILIDEIQALVTLPSNETLQDQIKKFGQPLGCVITGVSPGYAYMAFMKRCAELQEMRYEAMAQS